MGTNDSKKRSDINKTERFTIADANGKVQKVIFPHTIKVGLLDNSTYSATISGSIHHTHEGKSFLVAGSNTTITSASNGQVTITAANSMGAGFVIEDDSGDEVTITEGKEVKIIGSGGITTNWTDITPGSDADPYDLTITASDLTIAGDSGSTAMTLGDTLTIAGGTNCSTAMSGDTLTINATSGGGGGSGGASDVGWLGRSPGQIDTTGSLGVSGSLSVAAVIDHIGDSDTSIVFDTDEITLKAGTKAGVQLSEGSVDKVFLGGVPNNVNYDQVLVLSGGAAASVDETLGTDVAFFVSGSRDSRNTTERGTAVFGGDVHISGSINKSTTTWAFYQAGTPGGNPTNEYYFEWQSGTTNQNNPEANAQNDYWQYFPKGGRIVEVVARGGANGDSSDDNPYIQRLIFAMYTWSQAWRESGAYNGDKVFTPTGHITSSLPIDDLARDGSGREHRAVHVIDKSYFNSNTSGSFKIPAGKSICMTYRGVGTAGAISNTAFYITVEKNL